MLLRLWGHSTHDPIYHLFLQHPILLSYGYYCCREWKLSSYSSLGYLKVSTISEELTLENWFLFDVLHMIKCICDNWWKWIFCEGEEHWEDDHLWVQHYQSLPPVVARSKWRCIISWCMDFSINVASSPRSPISSSFRFSSWANNLIFIFSVPTQKGRCLPFPTSTSISQSPLEVIHLDLWGPTGGINRGL